LFFASHLFLLTVVVGKLHNQICPVPTSCTMFIESFRVESPDVEYTRDFIHSSYRYSTTELGRERCDDGLLTWIVKPTSVRYDFKTSVNVPKLG
jgi:hypothetical protein